MKKWLTRLLFGILTLALIVIAAVAALPWLIDPNDFKPEIQSLAARQGVDLQLSGPIAWRFYPALGLSLRDVSVATDDAEQPLAKATELTAAVAVLPLLRRQVRVDEVLIDGAQLYLQIDESGRGNWEELLGNKEAKEQQTQQQPTPASSKLDLTVDSITLGNTAIVYDDRQNQQRAELHNLQLTLSGVNLNQQAFPFHVSADVQSSSLAKPLTVAANGQLRINDAINQFAVDAAELSAAGVTVQLNIAAQTDPQLSYQGNVALVVNDFAALFNTLGQTPPATSDPNVLKRLRLDVTVDGSDRAVTAKPFTLVLDDSTFKGNSTVTFADSQQPMNIALALDGDTINVDRYLAPETETAATAGNTAGGDSPLPLEALRGINADITATLNRVVVKQMPLTQIELALNGADGRWQLKKLNADFYQGKLSTSGELNAQGDQAQLQLNADMRGLALKPLLTDLAAFDDISGSVDAHVEGNTRAATAQQLFERLDATVNFTGNSLLLSGLNAEQQYCEMVAQLTRADADATAASQDTNAESQTGGTTQKTWAPETAIQNVRGQLRLKDLQLTLEGIQAQVANLALTARGAADLNKQVYAVSLPMRLTDNKTSADGCAIDSKFLINREVDILGCDGSLAQLELAKQCGLKSGAIRELAKEALRYNADKKITEKKQDVREQLKEKLREKLGDEEESQSTRELLKNILKR